MASITRKPGYAAAILKKQREKKMIRLIRGFNYKTGADIQFNIIKVEALINIICAKNGNIEYKSFGLYNFLNYTN